MRLQKIVAPVLCLLLQVGLFLTAGVSPAQAMRADHGYVKELLEARFQLPHREVGMATTRITSSDCKIRIVDGSEAPSASADQAALQVVKGGVSLNFFISEKMSYDVILGSVLDFTSEKRGGLTTHATLLKIGANGLVITELALYPSNEHSEDEKTKSIRCQL